MLPEVEFEDEEAVPDFKTRPAMCAFDMDGRESVALIPSEFLGMVEVGERRARFVLNERGMGGDYVRGDFWNGEEGKGGDGNGEEREGEGVGAGEHGKQAET